MSGQIKPHLLRLCRKEPVSADCYWGKTETNCDWTHNADKCVGCVI